jgi:CcmD family protein
VSYLIAAYAIVIGTLVSYGWWLQGQRRQLERQDHPPDRGVSDA